MNQENSENIGLTEGNIYKTRRDRTRSLMKEGLAIISNGEKSPDPMLNDKNLEYLAGRLPNGSILLISVGQMNIDRFETQTSTRVGRGLDVDEILFLPESAKLDQYLDGESNSDNELIKQNRIDTIKPLSMFGEILSNNLVYDKFSKVWVNIPYFPSLHELNSSCSNIETLINNIHIRFPWISIQNCANLIHEQRWVKDEYEIACIEQAYSIQTAIFEKIMANLRVFTNESDGKAIFESEIAKMADPKISGQWHDRYSNNIIVASGPNSTIPHYMTNIRKIQPGDLILIDGGVQYCGYSSDISRTFPANGIFTERQREFYSIVLEAHSAAISTMRPGSNQLQAHQAAFNVFQKYGLAKYTFGECGHPIGLNIHDATSWHTNDAPFKPGVVVAIEPMIFLPEEGIGIRIEDGILITQDGCKIMPGPPRNVADIEKLCLNLKK